MNYRIKFLPALLLVVSLAVSPSRASAAGGAGGVAKGQANKSDKQPADTKTDKDKDKDKDEDKGTGTKKAEAKPATAAGVTTRIVVGSNTSATKGVRKDVDPKDNQERFLLLAPGGPLLVELTILFDGQPFRMAREGLVDKVLAAADTDGDGKATWEELLKNPRGRFGRTYSRNAGGRGQNAAKQYDKNSNKLVERDEARLYLAATSGGGAFSIYPYPYGSNQPDVSKLLDVNQDGSLDADELAGAGARLQSRDVDDNELVELGELNGNTRNRVYAPRRTAVAAPSLAVLLGPAVNYANVFAALKKKYGKDDKIQAATLPQSSQLLKAIDANKNSVLDREEVYALDKIEPHLALALAFNANNKSTLKVTATGLDLAKVEPAQKDARSASVDTGPLRLQLSVSASVAAYNYANSAKAMLQRYDKDKNAYIAKDEIGNQQSSGTLFRMFDENTDGKIFEDEILNYYKRQMLPMQTMARLSAQDQGNSLFGRLDETGDGRLSLREVKNVAKRLGTLDKSGDGVIQADEVPRSLAISIGRGNFRPSFGGNVRVFRTATGARSPAPQANQGPQWFVRMDRNGDGDVSQREFLGSEEQFGKLDSNQDGFIERKEAETVDKAASRKGQ